jgi:lysyl-tRNA synthetase class 1
VLPISPASGRVLQVPVEVVDAEAGTIAFTDEDGARVTQSALGGLAKLQWKVDWAARWVALGVDYEMAGKDLIESVIQSGKIARVLGGRPPEGFNYEMFLDENGEKISKSKGNGLSLEQWLRYGSEESLAFYIYREPRKAKSLHLGVIPRAVDDYWQYREKYADQPIEQKLGNPVHHIHAGKVPEPYSLPVTFGLLLNLVGVLGANASAFQVFRYLRKLSGEVDSLSAQTLDQGVTAEEWEKLPAGDELSKLVDLALAFHRDFVAPTLKRRAPVGKECDALNTLDAALALLGENATSAEIQNAVYEVGKTHFGKENLRAWFQALYETLLGSSQGPRMGSFIALYGVDNTRRLIAEALAHSGQE